MEVLVSAHPGISDDCIVSVRCGSTRRQAPLDIARCQALKFPSNLETLNEPLKIDVLKPVASARLVLHPQQDEYFMNFLDKPGMAIGLNVQPASQTSEGVADAGTAGHHPGRKQGQSQGPASARDYLELHGVLKYVQSMLTALIQTKPKDPYDFMLHQLSSSTSCASARQPETGPEDQALRADACPEAVPASPPKPQQDFPVSPQPPPGNPFHLPGSRADSDHQTHQTPAAVPPSAEPAELTEPAPVPVAAWQDAAPGAQAETHSTQREALAEDTTALTAHSEEEASRIRLQTVLLKAGKNGVLEEILQNLFRSRACSCELSSQLLGQPGDGQKIGPTPLVADEQTESGGLGEGDASQLRAHVRERLTNAWTTGELKQAVQEALEHNGPKIAEATAEQSIQFLQDEIKIMAEESKVLHEQVDRLSSEMQRLLLTNQQLLNQIQSGESASKR